MLKDQSTTKAATNGACHAKQLKLRIPHREKDFYFKGQWRRTLKRQVWVLCFCLWYVWVMQRLASYLLSPRGTSSFVNTLIMTPMYWRWLNTKHENAFEVRVFAAAKTRLFLSDDADTNRWSPHGVPQKSKHLHVLHVTHTVYLALLQYSYSWRVTTSITKPYSIGEKTPPHNST